ncbi:MAG: acyl-ACP--UDP-N-acetylglucosamine O-acyltransferase [Betaproteobacteria bacterium]|nr:acyl-ACP--UDP-N-acetylglucosamine O-acyltransferase [Betaproteobacteria bacterium]
MSLIHPTAVIHEGAELAGDVQVGPYAVIGAYVRIDSGTTIASHTVIEGHTTIGRDNRIFSFASVGQAPQDKKYAGEPTRLEIGHGNTIREFCTINTGTAQDEGVTRIGDDNWIMAYVHIAHDVRLGHHTVLANNATLAGHVQVGDWATIGGLTGVHQFVKIGAHAMIGFQGHVAQDVPPYMTADGNPLAVRAVNLTGLKRRGFDEQRQTLVRRMHRLLYRESLTLTVAIERIAALAEEAATADQPLSAEGLADVGLMLDFLRRADRGIVR